MITKAVVLCGGLGTRFLPISKSIPKEMLPVINKPIIQYVVEELASAGIKNILIVVGRGKDSIAEHFDKNIEVEERLKKTEGTKALEELDKLASLAHIHFIRQIEPLGTGHAVLCAKHFVGKDPFLLHYGDELFVAEPSRTLQLIKEFERVKLPVVAAYEVDKTEVFKYGIIKGRAPSNLVKLQVLNSIKKQSIEVEEIIEKPKEQDAPSNLAFIGSAILTSEIFKYISVSQERIEYGIIDALNILADKKALYAINTKGMRLDVGSPKGLIEANNYLAKNSLPPIL